jgi:hypothetical protein
LAPMPSAGGKAVTPTPGCAGGWLVVSGAIVIVGVVWTSKAAGPSGTLTGLVVGLALTTAGFLMGALAWLAVTGRL